MKHHSFISYKRQRLLSYTLLGSCLLIAGMHQAKELPAIALKETEYRLNGTSIQSVKEVAPYYEACHTVYDAQLYEGEIVVTKEGSAGKQETTTLLTYLNGYEVDETVIETRIVTPAIAREIHIGTKKRPAFLMPVSNYVITSYVGPRWGRSHNGIDLAVTVGTPVYACASGVVVQAGWNGGYGISVYVDHGNGLISRYGHLSETAVSIGQTVSQGDLLGLSGNTGNSTGPHLHFEMRLHDEVVDPLNYVETESK